MQMHDYLNESSRTAATEAYFSNVSGSWARSDMHLFVDVAETLDSMKKSIFYNRPYCGDKETGVGNVRLEDLADVDVLHGILGVATESAELVELLVKKQGHDRARIIDECGDILWYLAMMFRSLGVTFEEVAERNIEKLKVRFPEKFEASLANTRDDMAEQAVFDYN